MPVQETDARFELTLAEVADKYEATKNELLRLECELRKRLMTIDQSCSFNLTPAQKRVAGGLVKGLTNKEIANETHTSERTVKFHTSNIYAILGVDGRTKAVSVLLTSGIQRA